MSLDLCIFSASFVIVFVLIKTLLDTELCGTTLQIIVTFLITHVIRIIVNSYLPKKLIPNLEKKAVFVTGCDSGFGNLFAKRLDTLGVTVYAGCLFSEGPLAKELKKNSSERLHIVQLDVTKDTEVEAAFKYVKNTLKDKVLATIVSNAGISTFGEMEWHSLQDTQKVLDVNLYGQIRMVNAFLPLLRECKGRIVNVVSIFAHFSFPGLIPYCMSKSASLAYTDGIRRELKKFNVSVHSIEPSFYKTPIINLVDTSTLWKHFPSELKESYGNNYYDIFKNRLKMFMFAILHSESKIYHVVDSLLDASLGSNPKVRYSPSLLCYAINVIFRVTPRAVDDLFIYYFCQPHNK